MQDGIHSLLPRDMMSKAAKKLRDTYAIKPGIPLFKREFGYYSLEEWKTQGMPENADLNKLFNYDENGNYRLRELGWCEAAFYPKFEEKLLEDRGEHELVRDFAGRSVLYFKGARNGFMPEYVDHPVKDMKTWQENVKWRLAPKAEGRFATLAERMEKAKKAAGEGLIITQGLIGGYMYLRSLIGPEQIMYAFYDMPEVIHDCMKSWLLLSDTVIAEHQKHVTIDEIFFAEDICYNHGSLISPEYIKEFLFPYYQQLLQNLKPRQLDKARHLYVQVDTDGFANPVIPLYREAIGMDVMSPFEVASGCDVVEIGKQFPNLAILGGLDKRELAKGKVAIDKMLNRIIPAMRQRGGFIPTCDHGVPAEVSYQDYLYYRKKVVELGGE